MNESRTENRSWPSRRKKRRPALQPRSLVDWALHYTDHRALFPLALSSATAPVSAATTHQGPPASGHASSGTPPLHSRPVLLLAAHSLPLSWYERDACSDPSLLAAKQHLASYHSTPATEQCPLLITANFTITHCWYHIKHNLLYKCSTRKKDCYLLECCSCSWNATLQ
jgi:hypothetical protein